MKEIPNCKLYEKGLIKVLFFEKSCFKIETFEFGVINAPSYKVGRSKNNLFFIFLVVEKLHSASATAIDGSKLNLVRGGVNDSWEKEL